MACDTVAALLNAYSQGRSVRVIADAAGIPPHRIQRYMKPSFVLVKMPTADRIQEIASAYGAPFTELRDAFVADLVDVAPPEVVEDQRERELTRLYRRLPEAYQETALKMLRSLSHLERAVSHDGTPESGDSADAM